MPDRATVRSAVVRAPLARIVTALTDFERFPEWQQSVAACEVHERDADGLGTLVRMRVDAKVRIVGFTVRYSYDLPRTLGWQLVDGDLRVNTGRYEFTTLDERTTRVSVDIVAEPAFYVPGPVKRVIRDQAIRTAIRELRHRVEAEPA